MSQADYGYSKPRKINSGLPNNFDPKWGCLIPVILFVIVMGLILGIAYLFDLS